MTWDGSGPRLVTQNELIDELEQLARGDFADAPAGSLVVEGLDAQSRPSWRGYYSGSAQLRSLLVQLQAERVMARERGPERQESSRGRKP